MPRFFIDTDDAHSHVMDDEGHDLADRQAARDLAIRALSDMVRSDRAESDRREFTALVRGDDGSTLYSASLTLRGEWWVDRAAS